MRLLRPPENVFAYLGPCLFLLVMLLPAPAGMPPAARAVLASTCWLVTWWLSEAIPIAMTSLLPLVLFPLLGVQPVKLVADFYANPIIFLFVGGFIIALAMEKWDLHKRIALNVIRYAGTNERQILLGFIIATGGLSMWISNTATTLMMLPIALSIIGQLSRLSATGEEHGFGKALVLSIAFAASIGGMATIVGTPTNLILVQGVKEIYDYEIPFDRWFLFGFPLVVVLLGLLWWHLGFNAFRLSRQQVPGARAIIAKELQALGPISRQEQLVAAVFGVVAVAWILRKPLLVPLFPGINDTTIALIGAISLFLLPVPRRRREYLMDWETARRLPWKVILLFGGAFALAGSFEASGLTTWLGGRMAALASLPYWLILLAVIALVNYLTELTQNMATCTLMIPVLAALALSINVHPLGLMTGMTVAASCAFMMPIATAPNAIVYGSGKIVMRDMVRAGFLLNLISIGITTLLVYLLLPEVLGMDLAVYPPEGWGAAGQ